MPGPYRFVDRKFPIITYRTDPLKLRELVPVPLEVDVRNPLVMFEFIRLPDSAGLSACTAPCRVCIRRRRTRWRDRERSKELSRDSRKVESVIS